MLKVRFAMPAGALVLGLFSFQSAFAQNAAEQLSEFGTRAPDAVGRSTMLGHTDSSKLLHFSVSMPYGDEAGMQAFVDSVNDPKSRTYHQYLTPEEIGQRFGLPLGQVQGVANYLRAKGITVDLIAKNRLSILAQGTVSQVENAFHTTINNYESNYINEPGNPHFYAPASNPKLPASIAKSVIDVSGLESYTRPQFRQVLNPNQTRTLYNTLTMYNGGKHGEGRTVGISNWDGYRLSNVPLYYSQYGLPTPSGGVGSNITVITISGGAGSGNPGAEGDLDIQMVLGQAPLCNLRIYDGGNSDLIGVLTSETNDNLADVITESYGWNISASTATSAHNLHLSMSGQGITYMAASGDNGTSLEPYSYPDYDPEVLMVGGTIATTDSSGNRTSEVGWSGSGGGWSTNTASFNVLPSWQHGTNVPTTINHRLVPDVALHASGGSTGAYYFYLNGSLSSGYIGTSFASPVFAGSLAVTEQYIIANGGLPPNGAGKQRFGRIQDLFYSQNGRSDVWHDITSGSNGTLPNGTTSNAGTAWDFVTGWGSLDFTAFANTQVTQSAPPAPTNLSATAGNGQVSLSWTASSGATSYNVKRSTSSGTEVTVASSSTNSYTDTGLTNGTTYFYVVSAVNSVGESGNSNEVSATPSAPPADFTMSTFPSSQPVTQGNATSYTVTQTAVNGYSGTVTYSASGLPSLATYQFQPPTVTGSGQTVFTVMTAASTPPGTYTLTLQGTDGSNTHTNTVTLVVNAITVGDFSLSASPSAFNIKHGRSGSTTVTVTGTGGFNGTVSFSTSGLPNGASASFAPTTVTGSGSTTCTIKTAPSNRGTYMITITGTSGTLTHTTQVQITIT